VDHLFWALVVVAVGGVGIISAGHALIWKRDPRSALGWITVCVMLPLVGPFLYWSMGVNRIVRKARSWHELGLRLDGTESFGGPGSTVLAQELPRGGGHLRELRALSDRVVTAQLLAGNRLTLLVNGEGAYPAMLKAIAAARHSINLCTYIFDSDEVGRQFVAALREAADRGVEVRVIIDGLGEKYSRPFVRRLFRGSRVKVGEFLPLRQEFYVNLRNHRKLLVVDGETAFTGGMNIGTRHLVARSAPPPPVKDLHFMVAGPVVGDLQRVFLEDWHFVSGEIVTGDRFFPPLPPAGPALARVIGDGPDKEFRTLHTIVMGALACARRRVAIMTPYFIPDRPVVAALITAALRGVAITLVLPARNNLPYVHWATRAYLWELIQHGIRVYYQPPPFVHTKMFLMDGVWSLIGSANLDPRSLRLNFELNLEVYDPGFHRELNDHFRATLALSREVTLAEVDGRSLPEKLRDATAKLFSPYL
jgi:cardiolipin synthase